MADVKAVTRRVLMVVLTALVLVQTMGALHRVAHAHQSAGIASHVATDNAGVLAAIWGEHRHATECQLLDHACPDLLQMAVWDLPLVWAAPAGVAVWRQAWFALLARFYAVRGPPAALL